MSAPPASARRSPSPAGGRPPRRGLRAAARSLVAATLLAASAAAGAQTLVPSVGADAAGARAALALEDVAVAGVDIDVGVAAGTGSATGGATGGVQLAAQTALRSNLSFGPLGSVVFRGDARVATRLGGSDAGDGAGSETRFGVGLAAEGSYGPVALAVRAGLASTDRASVLPTVDPAAFAQPAATFGEGALRGSAALAGQLRLGGGWIAELEPELLALRGDGGWSFGGRLRAAARLRRAVDDDDLVIEVRGFAAPAAAARPGSAAVGVGYTFNERRAPSWRGALWFGAGRRPAPGATLNGALRDGPVRLELALAAEPWRSDAPPYRAALLALRRGDDPLPGEWRLGAALQLGADGAPSGALTLGYALELDE